MKIEKIKKLVANLHDKQECVIHIRNLKQALNLGLVLKKVHRVTKFNQKPSVKPHIDMSTCKKWLWKRFFQANEQCNFWKNYGKCEKT